MPSDIDIASNALLLVGDNPISSFTEPGGGATAAANLYAPTYEKYLAEHPWSFAFKEQKLNKLSQTPDDLTNFSTAWQLPTDLIRLWAILPHSNYVIVGDILYSNNSTDLLARYIFKTEEVNLPPHFVEALQFKLASVFAVSVTEDRAKSEYYAALAKDALAKAKNVDSQGRPQESIIDSPFVDVRFSGTGFRGF